MWKLFLNFKQIQKFSFSKCKWKTQKILDINTHENLDTYFWSMVQDKSPKGKSVFWVRDFIFLQRNYKNKNQQYLSIFSLEIWTQCWNSFLKKRAKNSLEICAG